MTSRWSVGASRRGDIISRSSLLRERAVPQDVLADGAEQRQEHRHGGEEGEAPQADRMAPPLDQGASRVARLASRVARRLVSRVSRRASRRTRWLTRAPPPPPPSLPTRAVCRPREPPIQSDLRPPVEQALVRTSTSNSAASALGASAARRVFVVAVVVADVSRGFSPRPPTVTLELGRGGRCPGACGRCFVSFLLLREPAAVNQAPRPLLGGR